MDDEPENLRAFQSVFRRDYNIDNTGSPSQGMDYLHNNDDNLIIMGQRISERTGVGFLKKIYEFMPDKPPSWMTLSAYNRPPLIDEVIKKIGQRLLYQNRGSRISESDNKINHQHKIKWSR